MNSIVLPSKQVLNQRYSIKKLIGQGGFGITYLAFDSLLDQEVCIKELFVNGHSLRREDLALFTSSIQGTPFSEFVSRFVKEAKKLAKFKHPYIVRVTDVFQENNTAYMVMDYIKGETLSQKIKREGPLSDKKSKEIFYMLLDAVEAIHQKKILHRDIKPGNILLTEDGRLVLIDFGSAREFVEGKAITHTAMVSRGYAPNEQYITLAPRGPYTDIYSLGATLYFMLTGKVPLEAPARRKEDLPNPRAANPKVGAQLSKVVIKAMEFHPEGRFQSVAAFREALQKRNNTRNTEEVNQTEITHIEIPTSTKEASIEPNRGPKLLSKQARLYFLISTVLIIAFMLLINKGVQDSWLIFPRWFTDSISSKTTVIDSLNSNSDTIIQESTDSIFGNDPKNGTAQLGSKYSSTTTENQGENTNSAYSASQAFIQFGNQQWMKKNLDVAYFRNGDPIREARSNSDWELAAQNRIPAWCYFENDPNNGKLYNWYAVFDSRGLAPKGWHVSSDQEWSQLISFLGGSEKAAKQLKENTEFDARLSGFRNPDGKFEGKRLAGRWWTRTPTTGQDYAYGQRLKVINDISSQQFSTGHGFSVRAVKD
jgi:uncharacterized protein (TIGR02145 family)